MPDTPTTEPPGQRTIQFVPKMQTQKKEALLAVAWLAQRDGGGYEDQNVTSLIARKLRDEGYKLPQAQVHSAMVWLADRGYAVRSVLGRRHIMFMMDPDVLVPEPGFVRAHKARDAGRVSTNGNTPHRRPPTPQRTRPPWLPALTEGIAAWWCEDPAEADAWAYDVARSIGVHL